LRSRAGRAICPVWGQSSAAGGSASQLAPGHGAERLDANARLGIPAHITVLFPFMPPQAIDPAALTKLERLCAAARQFRFQLDRTAWFGDEVLWLAPRDPGPFRALSRAVAEAFPAFPPYGGQFGDSTPHLTVGHGHPLTSLRAAEESVRPHLPIDAQATAVTLMTQQLPTGRGPKPPPSPCHDTNGRLITKCPWSREVDGIAPRISGTPGSVADALRMGAAFADYLNSPTAAGVKRWPITISSPSRPAHTMVTWGLPSGFRVTRCARAADSSTALALSGSDLMA